MANSMMKNLMSSFKQIGVLFGAVGLVIITAFMLTTLLLYLGENVVPALGLGNISNASTVAGIIYGYVTTGVTGLYSIASILSIASGVGILAVLVQMFGFSFMDRFSISVKNLGSLLQQVAVVSGIYTSLIFIIAILRIIMGIIFGTVATSLGVTTTALDNLNTLTGTVFTTLFSILTVAVGLLTLAFVAGAFGFEINIMGKSISKMGKKRIDY